MIWVLLILLVLSACFAGVVFFGAPYLPTLTPQVKTALELGNLSKGQTLIELGCGDGKVLIAAAERGARVVGYELNPILALVAWGRTRRYGKRVRVVWGNFWWRKWPEADVIFTFLLPRYMEKLDKKCMQYDYKPVKLVSFAFEIPGKQPLRRKDSVFLYGYR
ncbi:MAG TPA: class I SAM-dependent methyltransferase [Candidatus Saccharimonadales bacterium]|nr:class I SAM-dependent methyltransferase [Candidatus Saccharimonadales bacterium]